MIAWCHLLGVCPGIRSAPFQLATSMYPAYDIPHSNPTLLVSSTSCFFLYLPVFARMGSFPPWWTELSKPESTFGLYLWENSRAKRQRAHLQHSATPQIALQREFISVSGYGSRSFGRGWEWVILPGCDDPLHCIDPHGVSERASETKQWEW